LKRFTAWLVLTAALTAHIADEAVTGFLDLYNPAVQAMRERHRWLLLPTFTFRSWIALLALAVVGLLILSYWVRRGTWWTRYAAGAYALLMLSNGLAHLIFSVYKHAWMPGAYTSPLLLAAALFLLSRTTTASCPARRP
jgi:hypothetical protein